MSSTIEQICCYIKLMDRNDLAKLFKNLLEKEGVSQSELARHIGLSRAYVSQVMNAKAGITFDGIIEWASELNHDVHIIFEPKKQKNDLTSIVETIASLSSEQIEILKSLLAALPEMSDVARNGLVGLLGAYSQQARLSDEKTERLPRRAALK